MPLSHLAAAATLVATSNPLFPEIRAPPALGSAAGAAAAEGAPAPLLRVASDGSLAPPPRVGAPSPSSLASAAPAQASPLSRGSSGSSQATGGPGSVHPASLLPAQQRVGITSAVYYNNALNPGVMPLAQAQAQGGGGGVAGRHPPLPPYVSAMHDQRGSGGSGSPSRDSALSSAAVAGARRAPALTLSLGAAAGGAGGGFTTAAEDEAAAALAEMSPTHHQRSPQGGGSADAFAIAAAAAVAAAQSSSRLTLMQRQDSAPALSGVYAGPPQAGFVLQRGESAASVVPFNAEADALALPGLPPPPPAQRIKSDGSLGSVRFAVRGASSLAGAGMLSPLSDSEGGQLQPSPVAISSSPVSAAGAAAASAASGGWFASKPGAEHARIRAGSSSPPPLA